MKSSEKAAFMKERILSAARHLYYEKGLNAVPLEEVAAACEISKPLILYHFENKAALAREIYIQYTNEHRALFNDKANALEGNFRNAEIAIAYRLFSVLYYKRCEQAFRYYGDLFTDSFKDIIRGREDLKLYGLSLDLDTDEQHMKYIGSQYATRGLIYHYVTGEIQCSWETFARYYTEVTFTSNLSTHTISLCLPKAMEIIDRINIEFGDNFIWE